MTPAQHNTLRFVLIHGGEVDSYPIIEFGMLGPACDLADDGFLEWLGQRTNLESFRGVRITPKGRDALLLSDSELP